MKEEENKPTFLKELVMLDLNSYGGLVSNTEIKSRYNQRDVEVLTQTTTSDITYPGCRAYLNNKDKTHIERSRTFSMATIPQEKELLSFKFHASFVFALSSSQIQLLQN